MNFWDIFLVLISPTILVAIGLLRVDERVQRLFGQK